ncbi:MAG: DUF393 domain-containing protein [candidate division Zixibacteria bacterium]|nr:DUF393 domain-containing protein [candidate division Zixibacteria bacterium]
MSTNYLIYDDACPACLIGINKLKKLDTFGLISLIPLSNPRIPLGIPLPSSDKLREAICLITSDNTTYFGADALSRVALLLPKSRFVGRLLLLPGIKHLARPIYRIVAKHRLKLSKLLG